MSALTIRFGGYQSRDSVHTRAAEIFGRVLRERLGHDVRFEFEHNIVERGRNAADLLTLVESGELTLCYFSTSYLAARAPEFAVLDLPFVVNEREQAYAALDGELGEHLASALAAVSGFKLLGYFDNGFRHLSNRLRPIRVPADCQGMRIRTLFSALHGEVFRALGFQAVPLDVKDLVDSVRSGAVDAQDNPLTNIYGFGIHAFHPYITLTGHFFGAAGLLCHRESFARWPVPFKEAVRAAVLEATAAQRQMAIEEDHTVLARLRADGIEVVQQTDAERIQFVTAVAPVLARQRAALGSDLVNMLTPER